MLKRIREVKELTEAAYWQLLDLRVLLDKADVALTAAEVNDGKPSNGVLGEEEHYADAAEEYRPGGDDRSD